MSRLLMLPRAIGQLAHDTPDILQPPEVLCALENEFVHVMVSQGGTPGDNANAGAEAWRDLLRFLENAVRLRGR